MKCPKCGNEARDVARFCQRCHATLHYQCPCCKHEQRQGGRCEKCGVDFIKYITAIVAAKKAQADVEHERMEHRSNLLTNVIMTPFTLGIPLLRDLLRGSRNRKRS